MINLAREIAAQEQTENCDTKNTFNPLTLATRYNRVQRGFKTYDTDRKMSHQRYGSGVAYFSELRYSVGK